MKNLLPVLLVLALLVALAVATAVGIVLLTSGASGREVAVVLTYEIDPQSVPEGERVNVRHLAEAIDRRLNPYLSRVALVKADEQRQTITVGVFLLIISSFAKPGESVGAGAAAEAGSGPSGEVSGRAPGDNSGGPSGEGTDRGSD